MEERGMNERTQKLRRQSLDTPARIYMERADLMTDAYQKYEGTVSVPEMRAIAFKYFMEHRHLCINDGELIVGEKDGAFYFTTGRDTANLDWVALDPAGTGVTTLSPAEAAAMFIARDGRGAARMPAGFYGAGSYAANMIRRIRRQPTWNSISSGETTRSFPQFPATAS